MGRISISANVDSGDELTVYFLDSEICHCVLVHAVWFSYNTAIFLWSETKFNRHFGEFYA